MIASSYPWRLLIDWQKVPKPETSQNSNENDEKCGNFSSKYVLTNSSSVTLQSPGYPYGYETDLNCSWIFSSNLSAYHPLFELEDVNLENGYSDCSNNDYVEVFTSSDMISWTSLARYCEMPPQRTYLSKDAFLKVNFITNYWTNKTGFSGQLRLECGSTYTSPSGVINFDQQQLTISPGTTVCKWNIKVRPGKKIEFTFNKINLLCVSKTRLIIKNGLDDASPMLGGQNFCGNDTSIPTVPLTSGNRAMVRYEIGPMSHRVFELQYQEKSINCHETIIISEHNKFATITTPNYPNVPDPYTECTWAISSENGDNLKLEFQKWDLITQNNCDLEYVELRTGVTKLSQVIGRYCEKPPPKIIEGSNLLVKYFTQAETPNPGFVIKVSLNPCGGVYTSNSGSIHSPNYHLEEYPPQITCEYHIVGQIGYSMTIQMENLQLGDVDEDNCTRVDHVSIYSYSQSYDPFDNSTDGKEVSFFKYGKFF